MSNINHNDIRTLGPADVSAVRPAHIDETTRPKTLGPADVSAATPALFAPSALPRVRVFAALAGVLCVLTASLGPAPVTAQDTVEDARERQEQIEEERLRTRTGLHVASAELAQVRDAYNAAAELVTRTETSVVAAQLDLDAAELRARQIDVAIGWAEYDLVQLDDIMAETAVEAYLGDAAGQGQTLLQSSNIQQGATKVAMLELASSQSEDVVDMVRGIRERQRALVEEQDLLIAHIAQVEKSLSEELLDLEGDRVLMEDLRSEVESRVANWQARDEELIREDEELADFIANKQAVAAGVQPNPSNISTSGYVLPTIGGIGSGFGQRLHPILGYYRMHTGLDMGGNYGDPIYATNNGTVIVAGVQGGYGNAIVVDHGEGLSSLYAHQQSFEVGVGAEVSRGQIIGYVGSTGMSTGPHLHFEMRMFGTPIDPMPFMP